MSKFFSWIKEQYGVPVLNTLMVLWQAPQTLLGAVLKWYYRANDKVYHNNNTTVYRADMSGGVSLGQVAFVSRRAGIKTILHEADGHGKQSLYLGPLYLLVIGLPSILWAWIYGASPKLRQKVSYYWFYTERWADKLAGIER